MKRKHTYGEKYNINRVTLICVISAACLAIMFLIIGVYARFFNDREETQVAADIPETNEPEIIEAFLTPNQYSRPQTPLEQVNGIVIHYTANPGSDAMANRDYFEGLKDKGPESTDPVYASSHFIIGLDGTIIQCIPLDEISYASNSRNHDTIAIECCHPGKSGKFTDETYNSLVKLTAWLCGKYDIRKKGIIRHYDITGKNCPKYYVKHPRKWRRFKRAVFRYISEEVTANEENN